MTPFDRLRVAVLCGALVSNLPGRPGTEPADPMHGGGDLDSALDAGGDAPDSADVGLDARFIEPPDAWELAPVRYAQLDDVGTDTGEPPIDSGADACTSCAREIRCLDALDDDRDCADDARCTIAPADPLGSPPPRAADDSFPDAWRFLVVRMAHVRATEFTVGERTSCNTGSMSTSTRSRSHVATQRDPPQSARRRRRVQRGMNTVHRQQLCVHLDPCDGSRMQFY